MIFPRLVVPLAEFLAWGKETFSVIGMLHQSYLEDLGQHSRGRSLKFVWNLFGKMYTKRLGCETCWFPSTLDEIGVFRGKEVKQDPQIEKQETG